MYDTREAMTRRIAWAAATGDRTTLRRNAVKSEIALDLVGSYVAKSCHAHDGKNLIIAPVFVQLAAGNTFSNGESPISVDSYAGLSRLRECKELVVEPLVTAQHANNHICVSGCL